MSPGTFPATGCWNALEDYPIFLGLILKLKVSFWGLHSDQHFVLRTRQNKSAPSAHDIPLATLCCPMAVIIVPQFTSALLQGKQPHSFYETSLTPSQRWPLSSRHASVRWHLPLKSSFVHYNLILHLSGVVLQISLSLHSLCWLCWRDE